MIAILGATGVIGASLARRIATESDRDLTLFARSPERLQQARWSRPLMVAALDDFDGARFSLVINALGAGDPARVASLGATLFDLTRRWDERVLDTMGPNCRYVFLSSGAVYGAGTEAATADSAMSLPVNRLGSLPAYTAAKLACELRHRYAPERAILDVRVFGYACAPLDTTGASFLSDLSRAVVRGEALETSSVDMVRDYAGPQELWDLICAWEQAGAPNRALDLYTLAPVAKSALLHALQAQAGLQVRYADPAAFSAPTGAKPVYASEFKAAAELGFTPRREAMTVVLDALSATRAELSAASLRRHSR